MTIDLKSRESRRQLTTLLRQCGLPGMLALALGLAALCGWLVWLPQQHAELAEQQDRIAHLRSQLAAATRPTPASLLPAPGAAKGPTAQDLQPTWDRLWGSLPDAVDATRLQSDLLAMAGERGVAVQTVQYRGAPLKGQPRLWRQQISLPVETSYPALREWLQWMLQQPAISVDGLDVSRTDVMGDRLKARVQVSLWWRMAPASGGPVPPAAAVSGGRR
jgi:hypothetical protein